MFAEAIESRDQPAAIPPCPLLPDQMLLINLWSLLLASLRFPVTQRRALNAVSVVEVPLAAAAATTVGRGGGSAFLNVSLSIHSSYGGDKYSPAGYFVFINNRDSGLISSEALLTPTSEACAA